MAIDPIKSFGPWGLNIPGVGPILSPSNNWAMPNVPSIQQFGYSPHGMGTDWEAMMSVQRALGPMALGPSPMGPTAAVGPIPISPAGNAMPGPSGFPVPTPQQITTATEPNLFERAGQFLGDVAGGALNIVGQIAEKADIPRVEIDKKIMQAEQVIAQTTGKEAPFGRWLDDSEITELAKQVGGTYVMARSRVAANVPGYREYAALAGQDPVTAAARKRLDAVVVKLKEGATITEAVEGDIGAAEIAAEVGGGFLTDPLNFAGFIGGLGRAGKLGRLGKFIGGPTGVQVGDRWIPIPQSGLMNITGRWYARGLKWHFEPMPLGSVPKLGREKAEGLYSILGANTWAARRSKADIVGRDTADVLSLLWGNRTDIGQHNVLDFLADMVHRPDRLAEVWSTDPTIAMSRMGQTVGRGLELVKPKKIKAFQSMSRQFVETADEAEELLAAGKKAEELIVGQESWKRMFMSELHDEVQKQARKAYGVLGNEPGADSLQRKMRSAFSFAYLLTPRFISKNFLNNYVTALYDGGGGFWRNAAERLEADSGIKLHRQAWGMLDELGIGPDKVVEDGKVRTALRKLGQFPAKIEATMRDSARYSVYRQGWRRNWQPAVESVLDKSDNAKTLYANNPTLAQDVAHTLRFTGSEADLAAFGRKYDTGRITSIADVPGIRPESVPGPDMGAWMNSIIRLWRGKPEVAKEVIDLEIGDQLAYLNKRLEQSHIPRLTDDTVQKVANYLQFQLYNGLSYDQALGMAMQSTLESAAGNGARARFFEAAREAVADHPQKLNQLVAAELTVGKLIDDAFQRLYREPYEALAVKRIPHPKLMEASHKFAEDFWNESANIYRNLVAPLGIELRPVAEYVPNAEMVEISNFLKNAVWLRHIESGLLNALKKAPREAIELSDVDRRALRGLLKEAQVEMTFHRAGLLKVADEVANMALHDYQRVYDTDYWLRWLAPWELWTTRSMMKWAMRLADRPMVGGNMQRLVENVKDYHEGRRSRRFGTTVPIPIPFLDRIAGGEWIGKNLYVDPLRTIVPLPEFIEPYGMDDQQSTKMGEALQQVEKTGLAINPALRAMMVGVGLLDEPIGGWDYLKETLRGLPWLRAADATASALTGGRLSIQPLGSEAWDGYRVDRQLANMAAAGEIDMNTMKNSMLVRGGAIFEEAKRRANVEKSIGRVTSFYTGFQGQPSPPGEERQYALQTGERQARLAAARGTMFKTETGGNVDPVALYRYMHPEVEARRVLFQSDAQRKLNRIYERAPVGGQARWLYLAKKGDEINVLRQQIMAERETRPEYPLPEKRQDLVVRQPPDQFWLEFAGLSGPELERDLERLWFHQVPLPVASREAVEELYKRRPYVARNLEEYLDKVLPTAYIAYKRRAMQGISMR